MNIIKNLKNKIMSKFKGIEQAIKYAKGKSSSSVFAEAHRRDYLAGYEQALKDSFAPEMLDMLIRISEHEYFSVSKEIENLIKKATE